MKSALLQPGILVNETENEDQLGGKTPLWSTSWKFSFKRLILNFVRRGEKRKEKKQNLESKQAHHISRAESVH